MSPSNLKWGVLSLLLVAGTALGEEERLKPFVLASTSKGEVTAVAEALQRRVDELHAAIFATQGAKK